MASKNYQRVSDMKMSDSLHPCIRMTTVDDDEHEISFRGLDKCRACHLTIMTRVRWSKVTAIVQLVVVDEEVLCIISRQELRHAPMIAHE